MAPVLHAWGVQARRGFWSLGAGWPQQVQGLGAAGVAAQLRMKVQRQRTLPAHKPCCSQAQLLHAGRLVQQAQVLSRVGGMAVPGTIWMWLYHQVWLLQQQLWLTCCTILMTAQHAILLQPQRQAKLMPARQHAAEKLCDMMPLLHMARAPLVVEWVPGSTGSSRGLAAEQWPPLQGSTPNRTPHKLRQQQQLQP